jgi:hypothetical protein
LLLNLDHKVDLRVARALDRFKEQPFFWSAKVRLRHARIRLTEKQVLWMVSLLSATTCGADEFLDLLDFAIEFVSSLNNETDIFRQLNALKRRYASAVTQQMAYEERLRHSNMETLMALEGRPPYIDRTAALHAIDLIDHLCADLYGGTEDAESDNYVFTISAGLGNNGILPAKGRQ